MIYHHFRNTWILMFWMFCLLVPVSGQTGQPASPTPAMQAANELYQAQKWDEAAKAYEGVTKTEPDNSRAWLRLASSLQQSGKYDDAITIYQRALDKFQGPMKSIAVYNLAAANAKLGNKEKAFEWLNNLSAAGLNPFLAGQLKSDEDLASLRSDSRFKDLLVVAEKVLKPCMFLPKARELDFWVGEWDVMANGQKLGTSVIQLVEDGCAVIENWSGAGGQTGKSINFYNPAINKWRQTYVGNNLGIWEMSGEYKDGALRYEGEFYGPRGAKIMTRMTFFNLGAKVRQLGENSTDEGKTWITVWDAIYTKRT